MRCPFCSSPKTGVVETRLSELGDSVRRRRECSECGQRFTTYERVEAPPVTVVKRDGTQERFDRQKLLRGLVRAANKRPVSDDQLEGLADSIAADLRGHGPEVGAEQVGELALRGLAALDPVTAIQFASVYRNFADLNELEAEVRRLKEEPIPGSDQLPLDQSIPSDSESSIGLSPSGDQGESTDKRRGHVRQP
jgi:transcriptional repressor NrdR